MTIKMTLLCAFSMPYIVIPGYYKGKVGVGNWGVVYDTSTGWLAFGVIGDVGPTNKTGEVSVKLAQKLGFNETSKEQGVSGGTRFLYILFPNSVNANFDYSNDNAVSNYGYSLLNRYSQNWGIRPFTGLRR